MDLPLEVWVRARVDGVIFQDIEMCDIETAVVASADGSELPAYVREIVRRDPVAFKWTIAFLRGMQGFNKGNAAELLIMLGSGSARRFLERVRPNAGRVEWTGSAASRAEGRG